MKKKKIIIIVVVIILILCVLLAYWIYQINNQNMEYKFENDKLYITKNSKEWIEVPGNFSYTIKHLNEEHKGKYNEGTYQLNNKKIVFYAEVPNNGSSYDGITVKDSGFSSKIISLTSYSENYKDIEIARYVSK